MSGVPNLSRFAPKKASAESTIDSVGRISNCEQTPAGPWRNLLRPQIVEKAVLVADIVLIVSIGFISSLTYLWAAKTDSSRALSFVGVGLIIAFNFIALMAARRNYDIKNLAQFARQA